MRVRFAACMKALSVSVIVLISRFTIYILLFFLVGLLYISFSIMLRRLFVSIRFFLFCFFWCYGPDGLCSNIIHVSIYVLWFKKSLIYSSFFYSRAHHVPLLVSLFFSTFVKPTIWLRGEKAYLFHIFSRVLL